MSSHPNQSWMGSCPGRTKLTPYQFCFPGSHDTGAYQRPNFNIIASNEKITHSVQRFSPGFQDIATRWTMAQPGQTVYDQLMNGVRFLDFRISYAKNEQGQSMFYLIHMFVVDTLEAALNDIVRFLTAHPTELILIALQPYYQIHPTDLQHYVYSKLGKFLYHDTLGHGKITETVDQITKQGKQVIAMFPGEISSNAFFFEGDVIWDFPFLSVDNVPAKQAYILKNLNAFLKKGVKKMFQLTYTLTEVPVDIAASIFAGGSLKGYADTMNPTQMAFVNKLTPQQRAVICAITNDDQVNSDNVKIAQMLIAERVKPSVPRPLAVTQARDVAGPQRFQTGLPHDTSTSCPAKVPLHDAGVTPEDASVWYAQHSAKAQEARRCREPQRVGILQRVGRCVCCCCCGSTGSQSDDEDDVPLVR